MADIFISYARADRNRVGKLASALEAHGHSVWWDRQITGGSDFSADIERELDACEVVLVVWSAAAGESPWVKDEAAVGREQGKLVAISLDAGLPPLGFRQYHAIDFSGWKGGKDSFEFEALLQAVAARAQREVPATTEPPIRAAARPGRRPAWPWMIVALAIVAAGVLVFTHPWRGGGATSRQIDPAQSADAPTADEIPRVAVAEFVARGKDANLADLAAALGDDIANGLSRFSYLKVASREADLATAQAPAYRLEGALRRAGPTLRLTVQLFSTASGEQIWGESFDRIANENALLAVQDDLTAHVVASVADSYGALMRDLTASVAVKSPEEMTPYEAVLRHLVYRQRLGAEDHRLTLAAAESAVKTSPNNANAWSALAGLYTEEYKHSYNPLPGSLDRALQAARRAVTLEPDNAYANFILAETYYFRQDLGAFRASAERAISLNPYDSDSMAMIGILMGYGGDWVRGVELAERAMELNPNHPGWYRFGIVFNHLRLGEFEAALESAQRINLPRYFPDPYARALAHAYLGHQREAQQAFEEFLALWPDGDLTTFREVHLDRWFYASPEITKLTLEGLEIAGFEID